MQFGRQSRRRATQRARRPNRGSRHASGVKLLDLEPEPSSLSGDPAERLGRLGSW